MASAKRLKNSVKIFTMASRAPFLALYSHNGLIREARAACCTRAALRASCYMRPIFTGDGTSLGPDIGRGCSVVKQILFPGPKLNQKIENGILTRNFNEKSRSKAVKWPVRQPEGHSDCDMIFMSNLLCPIDWQAMYEK